MSAKELVLVTGGTGGLGHRVVERLRKHGHVVRVVSRHTHETANGVEYVIADLAKGAGVDAAVDGASIVVHCAGVGKIKEDAAQALNLVRAAKRAGVRHLVAVSVVGADRIPVKTAVDRSMFAYFASQRAKEQVVAESGLAWTNLRATQFYDGFILAMLRGMSKLPVVPLPADTRFQPIDTDEVADNLVELALGLPAGQAPDVAGPKIYEAEYLLRSYLEAVGMRRRIVQVRMPGAAARRFAPAPTSRPTGLLASGVGRTSWPRQSRQSVTQGNPRCDRIAASGGRAPAWGAIEQCPPGFSAAKLIPAA